MFEFLQARMRAFPRRHPVLWQVVLWSLPALIFGAILRLLLLSYSPYAYWGSDSRSYFGFTSELLNNFECSLNEKRRILYPIFLLPVTLLPGPMLRWLAILQAVMGLLTVLPIAYVVRRVFVHWKFWILPTTLIYATLPVYLWYEHELLAECLFFGAIVWAIGGWVAWVLEPAGRRKTRLWWWFFVPLAVMILTKPAGRFLLPGIVLGLLAVKAWRYLRWREAIAAAAVLGLAATMGDDEQGSWLLYVSAFPFTQLDTPKHADYKREIADMVRYAREDLMRFADEDVTVFPFLRNPQEADEDKFPLWKEIGKSRKRRSKLFVDLALEAIAAEPVGFMELSLNRILASANPEEFELRRFEATFFGERFAKAYRNDRNSPEMLHLAFGYPKKDPVPSEEWFRRRISPEPESKVALWLQKFLFDFQRAGRLFELQNPEKRTTTTTPAPTAFGWFVIGTLLVALGCYFRTLGIWVAIAAIYLVGVFLVGVQHSRYFAAVWPMVILALPALPDALCRLIGGVRRTGRPSAR